MRADYDSEADALSIDLKIVDRWDGVDEPIDDDFCQIALASGKPVNIEVLYPGEHPEHLEFLEQAADRYDLDGELLRTVAVAAIAAPDRVVELTLGDRLTTADS